MKKSVQKIFLVLKIKSATKTQVKKPLKKCKLFATVHNRKRGGFSRNSNMCDPS